MIQRLRRLIVIMLVAIMGATPVLLGQAHAQEDDPAARLLAEMSPEARVGQLFLVTFPGAEATETALITRLIREYHVGGVLLSAENGNIVNDGDTPSQVVTLVGQLQQVAWEATQPITGTTPVTESRQAVGPFVPLFVAVNHEGNGAPYTAISNATTPLPSAMALGATWKPEYAATVGEIVGQELRALGINMLLGPTLDTPDTTTLPNSGLGVRAFGSEPFWVGQMGLRYIQGVHTGSAGQVAVIAKHFPGLGMADRSLDEEISTVQRTLDQLRQLDLAPFLATAQSTDPLGRADGIMVSHIRFRGLEGGRFVTTRPVSVDSQVLLRLLSLPELAAWRESGGLTVSDSLGLRALRRFYDPNEQTFNSRRIAQEAFLAGNDILLISEFALTDRWEDQIANLESTITFFQEKYASDAAFQTLVDQAVTRILRRKLALYGGQFTLSAAQPSIAGAYDQVGLRREASAMISRDAVTLLSPPSPDLIPSPPTQEENIVIFTDDREISACAVCDPAPAISSRALQDTINRLYGPDTTGQIDPQRISSFTFSQLSNYLDSSPATPTAIPEGQETVTPTLSLSIQSAIRQADWIIFALLNPGSNSQGTDPVRRFLAQQADALRGPSLVAVAYDVPYYLDATEVSKLSLYIAAYSRTDAFIEASILTLFGELTPAGASPVSVSGIGYDLTRQITPDPNQTINLEYFIDALPEEGEPTPEPTVEGEATAEPPLLEVGDSLRLQTGVVVDRNGHPVPNGTPVQFIFTYPAEGLEHSITAVTRDGVAEAMLTLERTGQVDISIQADPVPRRVALQITIQEGEPAVIVPITPTPSPTQPRPTPTPTEEPEPQATPTNSPTPTTDDVSEEERPGTPSTQREEVGFVELLLALIVSLSASGGSYFLLRLQQQPVSRAVRAALWCVIGGMGLYLLYVLRLPGSTWLQKQSGVWAAVWVTLLGSLAALGITWWMVRRKPSARTSP